MKGTSSMVVVGAVSAALLAACSSAGSTDTEPSARTTSSRSSTPTQASSSSTTAAALPCPSNVPMEGHSDDCTGSLPIGMNTSAFRPRVEFRIDDRGWIPVIDERSNLTLLPPGGDFAGLDDGTSDKVAIYGPVHALSRRCAVKGQITTEPTGVGHTAQAIAHELSTRPGVIGTDPRAITVGGLQGYLVDLRLDPHWTRTCFFNDVPSVPMIGAPQVTHLLQPGFVLRYYFLDHSGATLAIEVTKVGTDDLDPYAAFVGTFRFAAG